MANDRQRHWDEVFSRKTDAELSWHQDAPEISLELADRAGLTAATSVIDIGGGTSRFADALIGRGLRDISVLDLSGVALATARARIGNAGESVTWINADVTSWRPARHYDIWHDRAVFHFLVQTEDRQAYLGNLCRALLPGGHAIIATFAPDGPETCSGLPVARYAPDDLAAVLGTNFALVTHRRQIHHTPAGRPQAFQFSLFRRTG